MVRKLGYPFQPELGVGAVAEGETEVLDEPLISELGLSEAEVERLVRRERVELERRVRRYHGNRAGTALTDRIVVVVDDGLATGFTARAAVAACRRQGATRVVLAVPVGAAATVSELRRVADDVVCVYTPEDFFAVGQHYENFAQVSDDEVLRLLGAVANQDSGQVAGTAPPVARPVAIGVGALSLAGDFDVPAGAFGTVVFAHGSGSGRLSPRNRAVAASLNRAGMATLLLDLLTDSEAGDRSLVFDIGLLAHRLEGALSWVRAQLETADLPVGLFGASTGAAAALVAAADLGDQVAAVVSRGGRPDLAGERLCQVTAPTLLIVGGLDHVVLDLNLSAQDQLRCRTTLEVVAGATHLFEESGALEIVADLAGRWFADAFAAVTVAH